VPFSGFLYCSREDAYSSTERYGNIFATRRIFLISAASHPDRYDTNVRNIVTVSDAKQLVNTIHNVPSRDFAAARLMYVHLLDLFSACSDQ
jgi:hypothetical protein